MIRAGSAVRRNIARSSGGSARVLDGLPSAAAAFGIRKLRTGYAGALVNIRRSSDNAQQDFYPQADGNFPAGAFSTFIGGGSGFVTKWYDQSGNANDAIQATAANQPQLVTSVAALNNRPGLLSADGGAVAVTAPSAAGIDDMFAAGGFNSNVVNYTGSATQKDRIWDKLNILLLFATAGQSNLTVQQSAATTIGMWQSPNLGVGAHVIDFSYNSSSLSNVATTGYDGVAQSTANTQPVGAILSDAGTGLSLGSNGGGGTRGWPGHLAEHIFWKTTIPSAGRIAALRANQKAYWGTP